MRSTRAVTETPQSKSDKSRARKAITPKKNDHAAADSNTIGRPLSRQVMKRKGNVAQTWRRRRCPECKHCSWYRIDTDGFQQPFCDNERTKEFPYPIGWLHSNSPACKLFEIRNAIVPNTKGAGREESAHGKRRSIARLHAALLRIASLGSTLITVVKLFRGEIDGLF